MTPFKSVERLSILLNFINESHYPSMTDIINYLIQKDLYPTERTIQRDLKTLRDLCFIEIKYNRFHNGYFIDTESIPEYENWMNVFSFFNNARIINETLIKSASNIEYIDFDRNILRIKENMLGQILQAIIDRNVVSFEHQSFWKNTPSQIELYPHLLKQYQNRWYVFGCFSNGEFRSFGLDRIINFKVLSKSFKPKMKHPKTAFDDIIGLVFSISEIEDVILSYSPEQGNYIKSQPIHPSQTVLVDDENEYRIKIRVRPNYELQEQILKQGERVKVMEPAWLKTEIKERLFDALNQYD